MYLADTDKLGERSILQNSFDDFSKFLVAKDYGTIEDFYTGSSIKGVLEAFCQEVMMHGEEDKVEEDKENEDEDEDEDKDDDDKEDKDELLQL